MGRSASATRPAFRALCALGDFIDGLQMLVELSERERRHSSVVLLELLEIISAAGEPWYNPRSSKRRPCEQRSQPLRATIRPSSYG